MFAVIFEVQPKQERFDEYLELAKGLKPKLEAIDNERFKSLRDGRRLVSLSTWRDEKAGDPLAHPRRAPRRPGEGTLRGVRGLSPAGRRDFR